MYLAQGCPTHRPPEAAICFDKYYRLKSKVKKTKKFQKFKFHKLFDFFEHELNVSSKNGKKKNDLALIIFTDNKTFISIFGE